MFFQRSEGLLITLEGGEGSGKSTLARHLLEQLKAHSIPAILVREPGATTLGEKMREILLQREGVTIGAMSELLLYLTARAQNLEENIRPALKRREVVICDRYNDSSMAYQAAARGLNREVVAKLCELATGGLEPHMTLFLDVDPALGHARAVGVKQGADAMEQEPLAFHQRVRQAYLEIMAANSHRMIRLSSEIPLEKFLADAWGLTQAALKKHSYFEELLDKANA